MRTLLAKNSRRGDKIPPKKIELFAHNKLHMQLITRTSPSQVAFPRACVHLFSFHSLRALQAVWPPLAAAGVSFIYMQLRPTGQTSATRLLCCKRLLFVVWMHLYFICIGREASRLFLIWNIKSKCGGLRCLCMFVIRLAIWVCLLAALFWCCWIQLLMGKPVLNWTLVGEGEWRGFVRPGVIYGLLKLLNVRLSLYTPWAVRVCWLVSLAIKLGVGAWTCVRCKHIVKVMIYSYNMLLPTYFGNSSISMLNYFSYLK
jgi:hypothetical protein